MSRPQIGLYRRVSTRHQLMNDRYLRAIDDMTAVMARHDVDLVVYDEGGIAHSGGTIRGRKVFLAMLTDVAEGKLDGIAAPDVRSLSRGEWMIDGKTIADTLIKAGALLFTRYSKLDLRNHGDLKAFQDELYYAMKEKDEIRQRMFEGQAARALNVVEGKDQPWARHRTMLGHYLEVQLDAAGQPRVTNRGVPKREWAKDPSRLADMATLVKLLDACQTRGALFSALYAAGVKGPDNAIDGGWTKRSLRTLLRSPYHQGVWKLVRNPQANIWYGLDPRSEKFDAAKVSATCAHLQYWTPAQARRWEEKFLSDEDVTRRTQTTYEHPLLGWLRCPNCHAVLVGKGKFGYICPNGVGMRKGTEGACFFVMRDSTAMLGLRGLLPLILPRLTELRDAARDSLKRRNDRSHEVELRAMVNEEQAILAQIQRLAAANLPAPESFTDQLIDIARRRQAILDEQVADEQIAEARIEAERAIAEIPDGALADLLPQLSTPALAELYRAFFAWAEVRPYGPGRVGADLVDWEIHNPQVAGQLQVVDHLARVLGLAA